MNRVGESLGSEIQLDPRACLVGIKKVGDGVDWIVQYRADLHGGGSLVILGEDGQRQSNHGEHREGQWMDHQIQISL
jgi:hypothetical protein